jgi:hypothetical protein
MYSASPATVNGLFLVAILICTSGSGGSPAFLTAQTADDSMIGACDPALARLFAPPHPRVGRYEVCVSAKPLAALVEPDWPVEATGPLDAFGLAGTYNRAALVRLYGGRRVQAAHGWRPIERRVEKPIDGQAEGPVDGTFESLTLISPYPDPTLTRLEPGTLIIRLILCCT